jgi:hypothetical protein
VLDYVLVDALGPDRQWLEQLVGRPSKNNRRTSSMWPLDASVISSHRWSVSVTSVARFSRRRTVVQEPAPLPADPRAQRRAPHSPTRCIPQRIQDVVVGQREVAVRLQLAIHLVRQAQLLAALI